MNTQLSGDCERCNALVSEYVDNALSARQVIEFEGHIARCRECSDRVHQMQALISAMRAAPSLDTADDFMAKLHARIDGVEHQKMGGTSILAGVRDWMVGVRDSLRLPKLPSFALGAGVAALAMVLLRPVPPVLNTVADSKLASAGLSQHVALTASNPFDDPVAAKVEAETASIRDSSGTSNL